MTMPETTQSDLVEQLEAWSDNDAEYGHHERSQALAQAAAEITRLRAHCEAMADALESIADHNKVRDWTSTSDNPETHWVTRDGFYAVIARNALAAYRKEGGA